MPTPAAALAQLGAAREACGAVQEHWEVLKHLIACWLYLSYPFLSLLAGEKRCQSFAGCKVPAFGRGQRLQRKGRRWLAGFGCLAFIAQPSLI